MFPLSWYAPQRPAQLHLAAQSSGKMSSYAMLQTSFSLAAVSALLSATPPPPSKRHAPASTNMKRCSAATHSRLVSATNLAAHGRSAGGLFDASAWEGMASLNFDGDDLEASGSAKHLTDPTAVLDVDVQQLPTFVFFADYGRRREDLVGSGDVRSCRVKLGAKLLSFVADAAPGMAGSAGKINPDCCPADESRYDNAGGRRSSGYPGVKNVCSSDSSAEVGANNHEILEVLSREDLVRIVRGNAGTAKHGPVIVMYHAKWCRKCAYLTPAFRHLAASFAAASRGGDDDVWPEDALFCRVDVSAWGGRPFRPTADRGRKSGFSVETGLENDAVAAFRVTRDTAAGNSGAGSGGETQADGVGKGFDSVSHEGSESMQGCGVCGGSGFVSCGECEGTGAVERSSADGEHKMAVLCPACVGYKKLRCPACGGKCYMC